MFPFSLPDEICRGFFRDGMLFCYCRNGLGGRSLFSNLETKFGRQGTIGGGMDIRSLPLSYGPFCSFVLAFLVGMVKRSEVLF